MKEIEVCVIRINLRMRKMALLAISLKRKFHKKEEENVAFSDAMKWFYQCVVIMSVAGSQPTSDNYQLSIITWG